jgi:hypothetical protein
MTGELLRGSLKALTTELGLLGKPLDYPFRSHSKLATDCWWKEVWQETDGGSIRIDTQTAALPLQQANDKFLMTKFIVKGFKNSGLVRLFLQVYMLAGICSGNDRHLWVNFSRGTTLCRDHLDLTGQTKGTHLLLTGSYGAKHSGNVSFSAERICN